MIHKINALIQKATQETMYAYPCISIMPLCSYGGLERGHSYEVFGGGETMVEVEGERHVEIVIYLRNVVGEKVIFLPRLCLIAN